MMVKKDKEKWLQSISIWIVFAAMLVSQCYQYYLFHQAYQNLCQRYYQILERNIELEESKNQMYQEIVDCFRNKEVYESE